MKRPISNTKYQKLILMIQAKDFAQFQPASALEERLLKQALQFKITRKNLEMLFFQLFEESLALPGEVDRLLEWYHQDAEVHPIVKTALFTQQLLIFVVGGKHTSEFVMWITFVLLAKAGYPARLSFTLEQTRDVEDFLFLFLKNLLHSRPLPPLSQKIITLLQERGMITTKEIMQASGVCRSTVKLHLQNLQKELHIMAHGQGKGTWYTLSVKPTSFYV